MSDDVEVGRVEAERMSGPAEAQVTAVRAIGRTPVVRTTTYERIERVSARS